ncbi:MAG: hypothetical protein ACLU8J_08330 [Acutalibacter sp.]
MKIDNAKYKAAFTKGQDALSAQVLELIGHPVGGVCPFAVKEGAGLSDESLKRFQTVFPIWRQRQLRHRADLSELEQYSARWVDVQVPGSEGKIENRAARSKARAVFCRHPLKAGFHRRGEGWLHSDSPY